MIIYCQKCKRHFFAGMERCPHCACEVQTVTWLKTLSVVAFVLALLIAFVVVQKVEQSSGGNRGKRVPPPAPIPEERLEIPLPPSGDPGALPRDAGDHLLRRWPAASVEIHRAANEMS